MQIDLSKYLKTKFTTLYDTIEAKKIVKDYKLSSTYEDIEFIAPKEILNISRSFLRKILEDRIIEFPDDKIVKKSVSITTKNKAIKAKFNETLNTLLKERKEVDSKLRAKVKQDERNDTSSRNKLLH